MKVVSTTPAVKPLAKITVELDELEALVLYELISRVAWADAARVLPRLNDEDTRGGGNNACTRLYKGLKDGLDQAKVTILDTSHKAFGVYI
jgi:hypothetical protein